MTVCVQDQVNVALQLHQAGQLVDAEGMYKEILTKYPENIDALNLFGLLNLQKNQFEEAISYIKKAIELKPSAYFYESLGRAYFGKGDFEKAIAAYKQSLEIEPCEFDVYFNLALAYKNNNQPDKAIETYKLALAINPHSPEVYFNIANIYENNNDTHTALEYYKRAAEYKVEGDDINYFLAVSCLKIKNFEEGWKYYEDRPCREFCTLSQELQYKNLMESKPFWQGEPIEDKTLFVYYEAGLGDSIMFARYLPMLKEKCARVLFKPQMSLVNLFKASDLVAEIVDIDTREEDMKFDVHIPIMSIPYVLQLNTEEIPLSEGFLKSNSEKVQDYKEKYFNNNKFKIGIKWQGNPYYDTNRIIPLEAFYKLFDLPNTQFYSLQKDDGAEELEKLPDNYELVDLGSTFNDFEDTVAAVENLDLVICNDTSVAHLVGALGKPCWIMLPYVSNWRWHIDMSYSPWYSSVKLFKQTELNNWDEAFDRVHTELKNILGN